MSALVPGDAEGCAQLGRELVRAGGGTENSRGLQAKALATAATWHGTAALAHHAAATAMILRTRDLAAALVRVGEALGRFADDLRHAQALAARAQQHADGNGLRMSDDGSVVVPADALAGSPDELFRSVLNDRTNDVPLRQTALDERRVARLEAARQDCLSLLAQASQAADEAHCRLSRALAGVLAVPAPGGGLAAPAVSVVGGRAPVASAWRSLAVPTTPGVGLREALGPGWGDLPGTALAAAAAPSLVGERGRVVLRATGMRPTGVVVAMKRAEQLDRLGGKVPVGIGRGIPVAGVALAFAGAVDEAQDREVGPQRAAVKAVATTVSGTMATEAVVLLVAGTGVGVPVLVAVGAGVAVSYGVGKAIDWWRRQNPREDPPLQGRSGPDLVRQG